MYQADSGMESKSFFQLNDDVSGIWGLVYIFPDKKHLLMLSNNLKSKFFYQTFLNRLISIG